MGYSADCFLAFFPSVVFNFGSRWCESSSRSLLGRRLVRLGGPLNGCRQPCRLRCQDWYDAHGSDGSFRCGKGSFYFSILQVPVWCFASDDWYGDWGSSVFVSPGAVDGLIDYLRNRDDGSTVWLLAEALEGFSDEGSFACGDVIGGRFLKVLIWETLKMRLRLGLELFLKMRFEAAMIGSSVDDLSARGIVADLSPLKDLLWAVLLMGLDFQEMLFGSSEIRIGVPLIGEILEGWWMIKRDDGLLSGLIFDGKSGTLSEFALLDLGKQRSGVVSLVACGLLGVCLRSESFQKDVWSRIGESKFEEWPEYYDLEGGGLWRGRWCVIQEAGMGFWWRYRRKEARTSSFMGWEWWLWRFSRGLTTKSKGRRKVAKEGEDKFGPCCMTRMEGACMWGSLCEDMGPTGSLSSRFVMQKGDIPLGVHDDRSGGESVLAKWHTRVASVLNDTVRFR
ncbi:hypothetical protein V6N11_047037 [Hibiscus sabdariffa]|uniref:Uncharacterized protein n=1 Tax=Hibiscus sabdariffa TaxID=183260 RepID=A0ABR2NA70_9ROSI